MIPLKRISCFFLLALSLAAQTAKFPNAVPTDEDLLVAANRGSSFLAAGINASTLTIPVFSASSFAAPTVVTIDEERIKICAISGSNLIACEGGRGYDGSAAATHGSGRPVRAQITAAFHNNLSAEVKALASSLYGRQTLPGAAWYLPETTSGWPHAGQPPVYMNYVFNGATGDANGPQFVGAFVAGNQESPGSFTWNGAGDKVALYAGIQTAPGPTTTLTSAVGAADLVLPVVDGSMFETSSPLYPHLGKIGNEWVRVCGTNGPTIVNVCPGGRGIAVAASSHAVGAIVTGLNPAFAANFILQKMPPPVDDVNSHALEIDVNNYAGDYTGAAGQGSSVGLLITQGASDVASHGLLLRGKWWCPLCVEANDAPRGVLVYSEDYPLYPGAVEASVGAKQMQPGGNVFQGFLVDASGRFFEMTKADGTAAAIMDYNGNFITAGYIQAQTFVDSAGLGPFYSLTETDAAADGGTWRLVADGGSLFIQAMNDARTIAADVLKFTRNGASPTRAEFSTLLHLKAVMEFPDNAAARAGGLVANDVYQVSGTNPRQLAVVY